MVGRIVGQALVRVGWLQLPRKRPLLQRGKQRIQRGQGAAVGGFEGYVENFIDTARIYLNRSR